MVMALRGQPIASKAQVKAAARASAQAASKKKDEEEVERVQQMLEDAAPGPAEDNAPSDDQEPDYGDQEGTPVLTETPPSDMDDAAPSGDDEGSKVEV